MTVEDLQINGACTAIQPSRWNVLAEIPALVRGGGSKASKRETGFARLIVEVKACK